MYNILYSFQLKVANRCHSQPSFSNTHTCMYVHMHTRTHMHMHTYIQHTHMNSITHTHTCTLTWTWTKYTCMSWSCKSLHVFFNSYIYILILSKVMLVLIITCTSNLHYGEVNLWHSLTVQHHNRCPLTCKESHLFPNSSIVTDALTL